MNNSDGNIFCMLVCWAIGGLTGLLLGAILFLVMGFSGLAALFIGAMLFLVLGFLLALIMCPREPLVISSGSAAPDFSKQTRSTEAAATAVPDDGGAAERARAQAEADERARAEQAARAEAEAKTRAEAEEQERLATAAREAEEAAARDAAKAEAEAAALAKAKAVAAVGSAAPSAEGDRAGDVDYDGDGVLEGTGEGTRPAGLDGPRDGVADDLKRIKGVGPKMEKLCNSLGFYHFDQIAAWTADEVAWVDANLEGFKGRVTRDTWVEQAKLLAAGGETAFSKKVDDGDVY